MGQGPQRQCTPGNADTVGTCPVDCIQLLTGSGRS